MQLEHKTSHVGVAVGVGAMILAVVYFTGLAGGYPKLSVEPAFTNDDEANAGRAQTDPLASKTVELTEKQTAAIKVEFVHEHLFPIKKHAAGSIEYDQDMAVQVFTNYRGRIIELFAEAGDDVKEGQTLFTIDSPDLLQAESTLIDAEGVLQQTTDALKRQKALFADNAVAQKDIDQAVTDQQTAEDAVRAARDAVAIFGKTEAEIDRIVALHKIDSTLGVASPITGRVTARSMAPGLFVQPGNLPAPYTIADLSSATAIPFAAVVWEGDGSMIVWVTTDRRHFVKRTVEIGLKMDGYDQIIKGLNPGELIAAEGAVLLSKMLVQTSD
jgi:cobalt-zinc-cadmium efflux system membrane fusion protein